MTPSGSDPGADFDRWLHGQLRSALDLELGPRPHPADARYAAASRQTGGRVTPIRFSIAGALGAKALLGGAVVALAAGAAGTVTTHSVNPETWGQHVVQVVESCKAGDGNVGRCVSAAARLHGEQVRAQHSEAVENATASPSPKPGERDGQDTGASSRGGSAASDGHGQSQDHEASPAPSTAAHGHARPSPEPSAHE